MKLDAKILMSTQRAHCLDAVELINALPDNSVDWCITDPLWPGHSNQNDYADVVEESGAVDLFSRFLAALPRVTSNLILILGSYIDPRHLAVVPDHFQFRVVVALQYMPPMYKGVVLRENDLAYAFTEQNPPPGKRVFPATIKHVLTSKNKHQNPTNHPMRRNLDHVAGLIRGFTKAGDFVLDPFCGSGAILVGCKRADRRFVGGDIDAQWVEAANQWLDSPELDFFEYEAKRRVKA